MVKNKKRAVTIFGLAALTAAGIGGVFAYPTDSEVAVNKFTVGDVAIEGLEPNYPGNDDPEVKDILTNQEIAKDPQIENKGVNDVVAFITVDSPVYPITVVNDSGALVEAKQPSEIFWFKQAADAKSTHANNFNTNWIQLDDREMYVKVAADGSETKIEDAQLASAFTNLGRGEKIFRRHVFGYKEEIQGSSAFDGDAQTAANKKTAPVFDKVQLKNALEDEIDELGVEIVTRYYAIQASEVLENSTDLAATINKANLTKIYDIFLNQNSANDNGDGLHVEGLRDADSVAPTQNGASGTTDAHVNRFGTDANVAEPNNVNPN